jgi:hypothetical protein
VIAPKVSNVKDGQILSAELVNSMISRIEYAADLLRQYRIIAGPEMFAESGVGGTRVSYFQPVAGGATPRQPLPETQIYLQNLYDLVGQDGTGRTFSSGEFEQLYPNGIEIDFNDIKRIFGSNASVLFSGEGFSSAMAGYVQGEGYAEWFVSGGSVVNDPVSGPRPGQSSIMKIQSIYSPWLSASFSMA